MLPTVHTRTQLRVARLAGVARDLHSGGALAVTADGWYVPLQRYTGGQQLFCACGCGRRYAPSCKKTSKALVVGG